MAKNTNISYLFEEKSDDITEMSIENVTFSYFDDLRPVILKSIANDKKILKLSSFNSYGKHLRSNVKEKEVFKKSLSLLLDRAAS